MGGHGPCYLLATRPLGLGEHFFVLNGCEDVLWVGNKVKSLKELKPSGRNGLCNPTRADISSVGTKR